jgi:2-oxoglutarate ferredoxin oxidoreductase subunit beta
MAKTFLKPQALSDRPTHYCPGCTHGVVHRLIAEVIDELGIRGRTVGIAPVGCAVLMYNYIDVDFQEAAHGRAPAMATGLKRVRPDLMVFTYQGDGDLASIGMGEIVHAANRGERFTTIFINNAIYGMTGGQMAPTTMPDQRTTTSPFGRKSDEVGMPLRMAELLASLATPGYITRQTVIKPKYIKKAKKAITPGLHKPVGEPLLLFCRGGLHMPDQLGYDPGGVREMGRRDLAALLSPRRQEDTGYGRCGLTMAVQTNSDRD